MCVMVGPLAEMELSWESESKIKQVCPPHNCGGVLSGLLLTSIFNKIICAKEQRLFRPKYIIPIVSNHRNFHPEVSVMLSILCIHNHFIRLLVALI